MTTDQNFTTTKDQLDWRRAYDYLNQVMQQYKELLGMPGVNTAPALQAVIYPLMKRYNAGERTKDLYDAIMELE